MIEQYWAKIVNQDKGRLYFFFFLTAIVITSKKNLMIYNEEILVALTFFAFVFFIYNYFGNQIKESLDERCLLIQQELITFLVETKNSLIQALQQHRNVSSLMTSIKTLIKFTKKVLNQASQGCFVVLNNRFFHCIKQKLSTLFSSIMALGLGWKRQVATYQLPLVLANLVNPDQQCLMVEFTEQPGEGGSKDQVPKK